MENSKKLMILVVAILFGFNGYTQNSSAAITGKWLRIPKQDFIVEVSKSGPGYAGRITWAKDSLNQKRLGFTILENLQYNSRNNVWTNGKIHDPKTGKTYDAETRIKGDGTLEVHAYKGVRFLGTKRYFKRVQ
ncbi:MAG TPA: DUF2147 domain-containing protein [Chitinophagaceae bacterium]|nr:DUF2147 domain-containing protein [Chitinophagaceae bacterium]